MAQRTFDFRPPQWRPPATLNPRTGGLIIGTVVWLALYIWLGVRLMQVRSSQANMVNLSLALICVVGGVGLVLAWRVVGRGWSVRWRLRTRWPALNLEEMQELSPSEFERYVAQRIFARQGYKVDNLRDVKDGGIDVIVTDRRDNRAIVQCKRYKGTVGESTVRDLYGTMIHADATRAYLVTTGSISDAARKWAAGKPIGLVDGVRLVELAKAEAVGDG